MKISKSKRQLAQLLIEAGVKEFPNGANWAAQDRNASVTYFNDKPWRCGNSWEESGFESVGGFKLEGNAITGWHQTVLGRTEFNQIVAETSPDVDGWIEWGGGDCPVDVDVLVCCKWRSGKLSITAYRAGSLSWRHNGNAADIIAYRLHKPERAECDDGDWIEWKSKFYGDMPVAADSEVDILMRGVIYHRYTAGCWKHWGSTTKYRVYKPERRTMEFCESVTRTIPEPTTTPALDQLLQDWRNADDFAKRKQAEADEAAAMRDEWWNAVHARAGEIGVTVGRCEPDDGWIEWGGGECPVGEEQLVRIKVRGETGSARGKAGHWSWGHSGCGSDIVAYRLARL